MKDLQELVSVINRNKTKSISILEPGREGNTKLHQLYQLLERGKEVTDASAFAHLYPGQSKKAAYYKLKHELRERLYNTAFFVDTKQAKFSSRKQALLECHNLLSLGTIMNNLQARENALLLFEQVLAIGMEWDFTAEKTIVITKLLNLYVLSGDTKEINRLTALQGPLIRLYQKETLASLYWTRVSMHYVREHSLRQDLSGQIGEYLNDLEQMPAEGTSLVLLTTEAMLRMARPMSENDFAAAARIAEEQLEKLKNYRVMDGLGVFSLSINLLACYIALRNLQAGRAIADALEEYLEENTYNWYKVVEMRVLLNLHLGDYRRAAELLYDATGRPSFELLPELSRETWQVYKAHIYIIGQSGKLENFPLTKHAPFRLQRYLNEVPTLAKDKRGMNVPILISQIMILLQTGHLEELDSRFEALKKYRTRYLEKQRDRRAWLFIEMLLRLPVAGFRSKEVTKCTAGLLDDLVAAPLSLVGQPYDREVLPYELSWELVVGYLK